MTATGLSAGADEELMTVGLTAGAELALVGATTGAEVVGTTGGAAGPGFDTPNWVVYW